MNADVRAAPNHPPSSAPMPDPQSRDRMGGLFAEFAPGAIRLAYLLTGDRPLAEDVVQEAFVRVGGRLRHLRDPEGFGPYLRRTVVNLVRTEFRRRRLQRRHDALERPEPASDLAGLGAILERDRLRAALLQLSARQRAAIVLRFYEDLSEREVADILGVRPGTVGSLVSRGLAILRASLGDE